MYWLRVDPGSRLRVATRQIKAKSTYVRGVLSWILDHRASVMKM